MKLPGHAWTKPRPPPQALQDQALSECFLVQVSRKMPGPCLDQTRKCLDHARAHARSGSRVRARGDSGDKRGCWVCIVRYSRQGRRRRRPMGSGTVRACV